MVDLPHPDGPSRARNAPCGVVRLTFSTAVIVDRPRRKTLVRPSIRIPSPVDAPGRSPSVVAGSVTIANGRAVSAQPDTGVDTGVGTAFMAGSE